MCVCVLISIDDEMKEETFLEVGEDLKKDVTEVEFLCERLTEIFMEILNSVLHFDENFLYLWCFKMN